MDEKIAARTPGGDEDSSSISNTFEKFFERCLSMYFCPTWGLSSRTSEYTKQ
jgi:hypothetical protein